jgi:hypothetical protein
MEVNEEKMDKLCLRAVATNPMKGCVKGDIFSACCTSGLAAFCFFETNKGRIGAGWISWLKVGSKKVALFRCVMLNACANEGVSVRVDEARIEASWRNVKWTRYESSWSLLLIINQ